jgi:hypothetical protein
MPHDAHEDRAEDPVGGVESPDDIELEEPAPTGDTGRQPAPERPSQRVLPEPRRWSRFLVEAWVFPLRREVLRRLVPWALLHLGACAVLGLLLTSLSNAMDEMPILPHLGFAMVLVSVAALDIVMFSALAWWEFQVIHASAWDPEGPLRLLQFDSFDESIVHPGGLALAALLGAAPPVVIMWALQISVLAGWEGGAWLLPFWPSPCRTRHRPPIL